MDISKLRVGDWYEDDNIGGFVNADGGIDICVEYNLTDADTDRYAVEVQNGDGYYDSDGHYRAYGRDYD